MRARRVVSGRVAERDTVTRDASCFLPSPCPQPCRRNRKSTNYEDFTNICVKGGTAESFRVPAGGFRKAVRALVVVAVTRSSGRGQAPSLAVLDLSSALIDLRTLSSYNATVLRSAAFFPSLEKKRYHQL